jgi:hypothetical protein
VGVAIGSLKPINLPYINMQENFYIKIWLNYFFWIYNNRYPHLPTSSFE